MIERVILLVMDSAGVGNLPDYKEYEPEESNTLGNISKAVGELNLPNLQKLGLGNIDGIVGYDKVDKPIGCFGKNVEKSKGKDTITGHWEISGIETKVPLPTFHEGFPKRIIDEFEKQFGTKIIGNYMASGTEILKVLGEEHIKTGYPIVYTSADSNCQIAAHEKIFGLNRLYEICKIARNILSGQDEVGRIIARPFLGDKADDFIRTSNRHDFSISPPEETVLDVVKNCGLNVMAVGPINDIFSGCGITKSYHPTDNMDAVNKTIEFIKENNKGIIFSNLEDFDMKFGHRNNVQGYANALIEFDNRLPEIMDNMNENDILIITADHGNDPTTPSTDHSREYTPLLVYGKQIKQGINLGIRETFSDIGQTICDLLNLKVLQNGTSFKNEII